MTKFMTNLELPWKTYPTNSALGQPPIETVLIPSKGSGNFILTSDHGRPFRPRVRRPTLWSLVLKYRLADLELANLQHGQNISKGNALSEWVQPGPSERGSPEQDRSLHTYTFVPKEIEDYTY